MPRPRTFHSHSRPTDDPTLLLSDIRVRGNDPDPSVPPTIHIRLTFQSQTDPVGLVLLSRYRRSRSRRHVSTVTPPACLTSRTTLSRVPSPAHPRTTLFFSHTHYSLCRIRVWGPLAAVTTTGDGTRPRAQSESGVLWRWRQSRSPGTRPD